MRKLFTKSTRHAKFKKLEHQLGKGRWPFVLKTALYWGGGMTLCNFCLSYLMGPPVPMQKVNVSLLTNLIIGIPLGFFWWEKVKLDYANQRKSWKLGAWGAGIFDDDIACDVIETAIHKDQSIDVLISKALSTLNNDTIKTTQGYEIIVASAMSHAKINKVSFSEIDDLDTWLAKQDTAFLVHRKGDLVSALKRVLSKRSDLNEMWSENEEEYPIWRGHIEALIESLDTA